MKWTVVDGLERACRQTAPLERVPGWNRIYRCHLARLSRWLDGRWPTGRWPIHSDAEWEEWWENLPDEELGTGHWHAWQAAFSAGAANPRYLDLFGGGANVPVVVERRGWSWFFINLRRRYINDRTWYGLALVAAGFGNLTAGVLPWWGGVPIGVAGLALMAWGLGARR